MHFDARAGELAFFVEGGVGRVAVEDDLVAAGAHGERGELLDEVAADLAALVVAGDRDVLDVAAQRALVDQLALQKDVARGSYGARGVLDDHERVVEPRGVVHVDGVPVVDDFVECGLREVADHGQHLERLNHTLVVALADSSDAVPVHHLRLAWLWWWEPDR